MQGLSPTVGFRDHGAHRPPAPPLLHQGLGHPTNPQVRCFEFLTADVAGCLLHARHGSHAHSVLMATPRHGDLTPSPPPRGEAKARRGK